MVAAAVMSFAMRHFSAALARVQFAGTIQMVDCFYSWAVPSYLGSTKFTNTDVDLVYISLNNFHAYSYISLIYFYVKLKCLFCEHTTEF